MIEYIKNVTINIKKILFQNNISVINKIKTNIFGVYISKIVYIFRKITLSISPRGTIT